MPAGAVKVARPTRWGNPFPVVNGNHEQAITLFRAWLQSSYRGRQLAPLIRRDLRGKDLACWCPLDKPCHADILLEIANE